MPTLSAGNGILKHSMGARNRVGKVVVPARQATHPGGIGSLESILGLLKSLKFRALVQCVYSKALILKKGLLFFSSSRNDISEIIENSLGSSQSTLHPSTSSSSSSTDHDHKVEGVIPDDCVFISHPVESMATDLDKDSSVNGISVQMAGVSFKSPAARQQQQQLEQLQQLGNSPHGWAQLRRQSDSFHFVRPSDRR